MVLLEYSVSPFSSTLFLTFIVAGNGSCPTYLTAFAKFLPQDLTAYELLFCHKKPTLT